MRIGVFTDSYTPYISGVVRSIRSLRAALEAQGHEVYIFGPFYPEAADGGEEPRVFRYPSLPAPAYPGFRIPVPAWPLVRRDAAAVGLDLVHAHSPFVMGQLGWRVAREQGIPFCMTFHTLYDAYLEQYAPGFSVALKPVLRLYLQHQCNRSDLVIAPTYAIYRYLRRLGVRTAIEVIPTGVDTGRLQGGNRQRARDLLGVPAEAPLLLYLGRLSPEKNLPVLVEAFHRVARARPDVHLALVGDGPMRPALAAAAARLGLEGRLHVPGAVDADQVRHVLAAADLYVFTSLTETQGVALVEAMAAGLPAVCVRTDVAAEVVRDGTDGLLVDNDPAAVAAACLRLLADHSLRAAMSAASRQRAAAFSLERMAARTLNAYTYLTSRAAARRIS